MGIDRSKRTTFEQEADLYDEIRSGYPHELIEDILRLSGIPSEGRILEIGCGSGNATVSFARLGYRILGIELGERLAALAAENCRSYPRVRILHSAFEDWEIEECAFDLAVAADSFHWIPPEIGYPKVARALKATGSAAFFWRVPVDPDTDWSREIAAIYTDSFPRFVNPDKRFTGEWLGGIVRRNFENSQCFGEVTIKQYFWTEVQATAQTIKGLRTFSMHHGIDEEERERLYTRIAEVLEKYGGTVARPVSVMLFYSKVKLDPT
ncbi:MAG TPA: methyltransferase domain-containing protein [Anaerolineae bacterium]|nr:methyltransferase domain-containing protein [Anaerolineae bacterium]